MTAVTEAAATFSRERRDRMDRLWARLVEEMDGEPCPKPSTPSGIARRVRMHLARGDVENWVWESAIDHASVDNQKGQPLRFGLELDESEATSAMAGTAAKIAVLARRVEAGQELWHRDDGPGVMVRRVLTEDE